MTEQIAGQVGEQSVNPGWVQVAVMGGDVQKIDIPQEGMTVEQAINDAGVTVPQGSVVTMNGQPVMDMNTSLEPNTVLTVVSAVKNG